MLFSLTASNYLPAPLQNFHLSANEKMQQQKNTAFVLTSVQYNMITQTELVNFVLTCTRREYSSKLKKK